MYVDGELRKKLAIARNTNSTMELATGLDPEGRYRVVLYYVSDPMTVFKRNPLEVLAEGAQTIETFFTDGSLEPLPLKDPAFVRRLLFVGESMTAGMTVRADATRIIINPNEHTPRTIFTAPHRSIRSAQQITAPPTHTCSANISGLSACRLPSRPWGCTKTAVRNTKR